MQDFVNRYRGRTRAPVWTSATSTEQYPQTTVDELTATESYHETTGDEVTATDSYQETAGDEVTVTDAQFTLRLGNLRRGHRHTAGSLGTSTSVSATEGYDFSK